MDQGVGLSRTLGDFHYGIAVFRYFERLSYEKPDGKRLDAALYLQEAITMAER